MMVPVFMRGDPNGCSQVFSAPVCVSRCASGIQASVGQTHGLFSFESVLSGSVVMIEDGFPDLV